MKGWVWEYKDGNIVALNKDLNQCALHPCPQGDGVMGWLVVSELSKIIRRNNEPS